MDNLTYYWKNINNVTITEAMRAVHTATDLLLNDQLRTKDEIIKELLEDVDPETALLLLLY